MIRSKSRLNRFAASDGQSLVELALLLPLLLLLVLGLINFAFVFQAYIQVVSAAGVGATYGATSAAAASDWTGITNAALAESSNWHCTTAAVDPPSVVGDPYGYQRISVTVKCDVRDLVAIPNSFSALQVQGTATRRIRK